MLLLGLSSRLSSKKRSPECFCPAYGRAALSSPPLMYQKTEGTFGTLCFLVRERGLEPPRRNHTHLKRACLPFQHSRSCQHIITAGRAFVNTFFQKRQNTRAAFWGQHRIMGRGYSVRDFAPGESMENAEILCVFPIFHTARLGQKIRRSSHCACALEIKAGFSVSRCGAAPTALPLRP